MRALRYPILNRSRIARSSLRECGERAASATSCAIGKSAKPATGLLLSGASMIGYRRRQNCDD